MNKAWPYRLLLLIVAGVGYWLTMAKTVSLWDCGEFIACIHNLGIAHPPGTPLFMILGKSWEMLFFFIAHTAFRINLFSVISSLLACLLLFEIALNLSRKLKVRQHLRGPCALTAALLTAFSDTFWFNAVEAEVYAFSMAGMLLEFWIILKWEDEGCRPYSHWIVLFVYVCFIGIGVHMYSMLLAPFFLLFIGFKTSRLRSGPGLIILSALLLLALIFGFLFPGIVEGRAFLIVLCALCLPLFLYMVRKGEIIELPFWALGLLFCSVIAVIKPFLIAGVLLFGALSLLAVIFLSRSVISWVMAAISTVCLHQLFSHVPVIGAFTFSPVHWDMWACLAAGIVVVAGTAVALILRKPAAVKNLHFYLLLVLASLIGFSSFLYIPIRSQLNPAIDQNNPENWVRLQAFIERKQYGNENMLSRMFNRRGQWSSQFGYGPNMGFFRYHSSQLLSPPKPVKNRAFQTGFHRFFAAALLLFTLFVWIENAGRNRTWTGQMLLLYAVCSLGLIFYMNFADGRRIEVSQLKYWKASVNKSYHQLRLRHPDLPGIPNPNIINDARAALQRAGWDSSVVQNGRKGRQLKDWHRLKNLAAESGLHLPEIPDPVHGEVRARDYFFTPAFILFTLMLSLAIFMTFDNQIKNKPAWGMAVKTAGAIVALVSWCLPFASHFRTHDRSRDYIASDFAFNVLTSCPPDAILFTNGDNDTFPLWYMQQVERLRTDVTIINFSLANTDWYVQQFIRQVPAVRFPTLEKETQFPGPQYLRLRSVQRIPLPADSAIAFKLGKRSHTVLFRTQDRVLMEAVLFNYPHRPICFTLSTPPSATLGLEENFQTLGLVHVLSPVAGVNLAALDRNLLSQYRYRHAGSTFTASNPTARRILANYRKLLLMGKSSHAMTIRRLEQSEESQAALDKEKAVLERYLELERKLFPGG